MLSEKEVSLLYETLLSAPGMNDLVRIDIRMPRKNVLLLTRVIGKGLQINAGESLERLVRAAGAESNEALLQISSELLQKAGLSDMNEKLLSLQPHEK